MTTAIFVGDPQAAGAMQRRLAQQETGLALAGWLGPEDGRDRVGSAARLGGPLQLAEVLDSLRPRHLILSREAQEPGTLDWLASLQGRSSLRIWTVPELFPAAPPAWRSRPGWSRLAKRALDLLVGLPLTAAVLPLIGLLALAVRLESRGPALFRQWRVGHGGRLFGMYKLRTMRADAVDPSGREPKRADDPRVTRVGRWLRRTSLDELPQLLNVLRGEMSLVGPRPELLANLSRYQGGALERFSVPQGITGWWQVQGRKQPMYAYVEEDLEYVRHRSLLLDLKILLLTPWAVLRGEGAF